MDNALSNDIYVEQGFYNNIAFAKRVLSIQNRNPQKNTLILNSVYAPV
jgi:hypothetical protein